MYLVGAWQLGKARNEEMAFAPNCLARTLKANLFLTKRPSVCHHTGEAVGNLHRGHRVGTFPNCYAPTHQTLKNPTSHFIDCHPLSHIFHLPMFTDMGIITP